MTDIQERLKAAGVRVKPLVWVECRGSFCVDEYEIIWANFDGNTPYLIYWCDELRGAFSTLPEAKAAAQAHHEAAVLDMLEVSEK